jgi:DNA-binding XRE family transcriptional regulator
MTRPRNWRKLYENLPAERRRRIDAEANHQVAELPLQELRRARELSQQSLAEALGGAQSTVSKLESQTDMYVSHTPPLHRGDGGRAGDHCAVSGRGGAHHSVRRLRIQLHRCGN